MTEQHHAERQFLQNNKPENLVIKIHQRNVEIPSEVDQTELKLISYKYHLPFHPRASRNCEDLASGTQRGKFFPV